ncbi:MAG TPA: hypothetical protein VGO11_13920 [Chthoniobacteraceae bacterium]|jgi:hypothetical protein|nr:hypothetical protein [Chthoniobacteraceae bacterium]
MHARRRSLRLRAPLVTRSVTATVRCVLLGCLFTSCAASRDSDRAYAQAKQQVLTTPAAARLRSADWPRWVDQRVGQVVEVVGTIGWVNSRNTSFRLGRDVRCWPMDGQDEIQAGLEKGTRVRVKGLVGGRGHLSGQGGMDLYACRIEK